MIKLYLATRLCLELVKTEPLPVIGPRHPDAKDIPAGFEAGTTVKVKINGKSAYHMVSTTMETFGATRWAYMRTEHWISEDGTTWRRHMILFRPGRNPETGMMWELTGSPFFFFDEKEDRWFVNFNFMAYDCIRSWNTPPLRAFPSVLADADGQALQAAMIWSDAPNDRPEAGVAVYEVGAGAYQFHSTLPAMTR